jgi:hypothetical protein
LFFSSGFECINNFWHRASGDRNKDKRQSGFAEATVDKESKKIKVVHCIPGIKECRISNAIKSFMEI